MYEKELEFLNNNIDLIEGNDWDLLSDKACGDDALGFKPFWDNIMHIIKDPDVNIDTTHYSKGMIQRISRISSTSNKKYLNWICEQILKGQLTGKLKVFIDEATGEVDQFYEINLLAKSLGILQACEKYATPDISTDINHYNSPVELRDTTINIFGIILANIWQKKLNTVAQQEHLDTSSSLFKDFNKFLLDLAEDLILKDYLFSWVDKDGTLYHNSSGYKQFQRDILAELNNLSWSNPPGWTELIHNKILTAIVQGVQEWKTSEVLQAATQILNTREV